MQIATALLLVINVVGLVVLGLALRSVGSRERALQARLDELGPIQPMAAAFERSYLAGRKRVLVVEILNPLEVAGARHKLAGIAAGLAPSVVRKVVYDQAAKITREQLQALDVQATVEVHVSS